jgi:hypothetical protein
MRFVVTVIVSVPTALTFPTRLCTTFFFADEPGVELAACWMDAAFGDGVVVEEDFEPPDDPHAVPNNTEQATTLTTPSALVRLFSMEDPTIASRPISHPLTQRPGPRRGTITLRAALPDATFPNIDLPLTRELPNHRKDPTVRARGIVMEFNCEMIQRVSDVDPGEALQRALDLAYELFVLDRQGHAPFADRVGREVAHRLA